MQHTVPQKGGIIALTKALARELGSPGHPREFGGAGSDRDRSDHRHQREQRDETGTPPLRRLGQPGEIAAVVEFIAGPGGSLMVGQIVSPNGGR